MTQTAFTDPDDPILVQGRRRAKDVLRTARRITAVLGDTSKPAEVSAAIQLIIAQTMEEGGESRDAYRGLTKAIVSTLSAFPAEHRRAMFNAMFGEAAQQIEAGARSSAKR